MSEKRDVELIGGPRDGQVVTVAEYVAQVHCPGWTDPGGDLCSWVYDGQTGALVGPRSVTPQVRDHPNLSDLITEELDDYEAGWRDGYDAAERGDPR